MIMKGEISDEEAEKHFERIEKEKSRPMKDDNSSMAQSKNAAGVELAFSAAAAGHTHTMMDSIATRAGKNIVVDQNINVDLEAERDEIVTEVGRGDPGRDHAGERKPNKTDEKKMPQEDKPDTDNLTRRTGAPETIETEMERHLQSVQNNREKKSTRVVRENRACDSSIHATEGPGSSSEESAIHVESQAHMTRTKIQSQQRATSSKCNLARKISRKYRIKTQVTRKKKRKPMGNPNSKVDNEVQVVNIQEALSRHEQTKQERFMMPPGDNIQLSLSIVTPSWLS